LVLIESAIAFTPRSDPFVWATRPLVWLVDTQRANQLLRACIGGWLANFR